MAALDEADGKEPQISDMRCRGVSQEWRRLRNHPALLPCPTGYVCLDAEHQVSVLGEELHQDKLGIYDVDTFVWVTLEKGEIPKGKYKGSPTYWASLDGIEIGYITATQYEKYKTRLGISPSCCIAFISQGPKKLELSLMLPKA